ncbi:MAG: aldose 1-epimerase [Paracoccaceae bacterium]
MIPLEGHGYRLTLDPDRGGSLLSLDMRQGEDWVALLEPLADPAAGLRAGSFVMAPFANRIADGRFTFQGRDFALPVNRPAEGMAIHGFARDRVWQVRATTDDHARLSLRLDDPALPWRFDLDQRVTLSPAGVEVALAMTNTGDTPMPFGMGLHPWFRKPQGATIRFRTAKSLRRDARGLPLAEAGEHPEFAPETALPLGETPWFDGVFPDWAPREALIRWPGEAVEIRLTATGALRHLHVFVPDDRPVFCAEPVSHLPDAINRPALPQMDVLAPGESLSGAMILAAHTAVQPEVSP